MGIQSERSSFYVIYTWCNNDDADKLTRAKTTGIYKIGYNEKNMQKAYDDFMATIETNPEAYLSTSIAMTRFLGIGRLDSVEALEDERDPDVFLDKMQAILDKGLHRFLHYAEVDEDSYVFQEY